MASRANSGNSTNSSVVDESLGVDDDDEDDDDDGDEEAKANDACSSPLRLTTCFIHRPLLQ